MKIRLDLAGDLDGELNPTQAEAFPMPDGATLAALVVALPFAERVALTSVNGRMVPPAARDEESLKDGDEVMLLPAIKGG